MRPTPSAEHGAKTFLDLDRAPNPFPRGFPRDSAADEALTSRGSDGARRPGRFMDDEAPPINGTRQSGDGQNFVSKRQGVPTPAYPGSERRT